MSNILRKRVSVFLIGCLFVAHPHTTSRGQVARVPTSGGMAESATHLITPTTDRAISEALNFLVRRQNQDGSFGDGPYGRNVGVCSLVGMALLSSGSTPARGPYGEALERCIGYIVGQIQESGFINAEEASSHGPMYGHGFATLFLCEIQGMVRREDLRRKLARSVNLIVATQNSEGGWRYTPQKQDADISVTVCEVMALRAARNAGFYVPAETMERATDYVKRCQNPDDGGFMYSFRGGESTPPRSAAAVVALFSAGVYEGTEIDEALAYLKGHAVVRGPSATSEYYFYGQYYAAQAMWLAGEETWQTWYPPVRDAILADQRGDGSWEDAISSEYGTAMAAIVLQMPNDVIPIFQR